MGRYLVGLCFCSVCVASFNSSYTIHIKKWFSEKFFRQQCFDAVGWVIWPVKIVPKMTYNVSSGTLNLCSLTHSVSRAVKNEQMSYSNAVAMWFSIGLISTWSSQLTAAITWKFVMLADYERVDAHSVEGLGGPPIFQPCGQNPKVDAVCSRISAGDPLVLCMLLVY